MSKISMAIVYGLGRNSRSRTCFGGGPGYPCPSLYIENHRAELQTSLRGVMENNFSFVSSSCVLPRVSFCLFLFGHLSCPKEIPWGPWPSAELPELQKGGVPAAPSGTATLLRLSPNHQFCPRPTLAVTDFRHPRLSWLDGRCVQGPGTYSPRHG